MKFKKYLTKAYAGLCLLSANVVYAGNGGGGQNGIIPTSTTDNTTQGQDFAQTVMHIFTKDIIPIIEIVGTVGILWISISALWNGLKEAQEMKKWDPLKNAIIKAVIVVVVGGALIYLLDQARQNGSNLINGDT